MLLVDLAAQHLDQNRIIDRERFSLRSFNIDHELRNVGGERTRAEAVRLGQIHGSRSFIRITKPGSILQKSSLLARREIRKSRRACRTFEGENAVAVNSGVTCKRFLQFLATHALDGIAPEAFYFSDDAHMFFPVDTALGSARCISSFAGKLGSRTFFALSIPTTGSRAGSSNPICTSTLAWSQ